ncbi:zeta toxin family protein [Paremcibacter congregatus]|uniref:Zeta toxin domain-containing protein n=1 Tax=Paremcibacter congregatus TaxID=2043170 RepID=A0A2G4YNG3_9PROT|nr:zeta toxin family protein [Paremcibacter congregatus]PHZ83864.1 hypothetical protein CRD36_16065 [Paremcibacter congregatus]QDE27568.1 hypothetical protein FIV45_09895 [Paremcibacter congregatus]
MANKRKPTLYVIAGPNGAGKSTFYEIKMKPMLISTPFINADIIQRSELKDNSMVAAYKAAEIAEQRRQELLANKKSFITETTFSHSSKLKLITEAKASGFQIVVVHINVHSPNLSVARVKSRVEEGGHNVPEEKIRQRYERNQELIRRAVLEADKVFIYDNSRWNKSLEVSVGFDQGKIVKTSDNIPKWVRALYKSELKLCE